MITRIVRRPGPSGPGGPLATHVGRVLLDPAKSCLLAAAALIAWGLKRHYADADVEDLSWILTPTARLAGVMTGATFTFEPGEGQFSREHLFLIEKSCAGINFMIAAFGMLVFSLFHHARSAISSVRVLVVGLVASYSTAVVVNAVRIAVAMWLAAHPAVLPALSAAAVHRFEGIVVYFGSLVMLHELALWLDRAVVIHAVRRAAVPLASYYAVTLALPLVNGAAYSDGFAAHAVAVLLVPPIVVSVLVTCCRRSPPAQPFKAVQLPPASKR